MYLTTDPGGAEAQILIDRKNDYWVVPSQSLHFPVPTDIQGWHNDTLIDGELVIDTLPDGSKQAKYLVFDCMVLDGKSLMSRTLDKRLAYFGEMIFKPYQALLKKFPEEVEHMHFLVELKSMQFGYGIDMMFKKVLPELPHGNDGLIFTCRMTKYTSGTDPHILKWKPENENSIDFSLHLDFPMIQPDEEDMQDGITAPYRDWDAMPVCNLHAHVGGTEGSRWFSTMHLDESEWQAFKELGEPLEDRIVECSMDAHKRWRFMRFRDDKKTANHVSTVDSVIESITDRVTERDLTNEAHEIRKKWKERAAMEARAVAARAEQDKRTKASASKEERKVTKDDVAGE